MIRKKVYITEEKKKKRSNSVCTIKYKDKGNPLGRQTLKSEDKYFPLCKIKVFFATGIKSIITEFECLEKSEDSLLK